MKRQGLRLEDSQLDDAERLVKLTAIAAKAAAVTLQLVQARDGHSAEPASVAFAEAQIAALEALGPTLEGRTSLQKNPHPRRSLAWATWIIGRLGGWDGYPSSKPPGPITLIPSPGDQNRWAQSRRPMDMISQGRSVSLFHASQQ